MKVHGKALEYRLYIDGVKIPCNSFSITSRSNDGASMMLNLLPIPAALSFVRGQLVHLFKVEGTNEPILRFFGILKNVSYSKQSSMRSVNVEVGSLDCRWEIIKLAEFSPKNVSSVAVHTEVTAAKSEEGKRVIESANDFRKIGKSNSIVGSGDMTAALLDGVIHVYTKQGSDGIALHPGTVGNATTPPGLDPTTVNTNSFSSVSDTIVDAIQKNGGDIIRGMWQVITQSYQNSNEYNRLEYTRTKVKDCPVFLNYGLEDAGSLFTTDLEIFKPGGALADKLNSELSVLQQQSATAPNPDAKESLRLLMEDKSKQIREAKIVDESKHVVAQSYKNILKKLMDNSTGGGTPIKTILLTLLSLIFSRMSIDPIRMEKSVLFHPTMLGLFPPAANVIFPNQYSSVTFNPNKWSEPTRTAVFCPPFMSSLENTTPGGTAPIPSNKSVVCISDPKDTTISKILDLINEKSSSKDNTLDKVNKFSNISKLMTEEETWKGVLLSTKQLGFSAFSGLSQESRMAIGNFLHDLGKYGVRLCGVTGELLDELIVGMPILILDGVFTIHGILEAFSYSVDQNGGILSDLSISCARFIYFEMCPRRLPWLDGAKFDAPNIGKLYLDTFGCPSIYNKDVIPADPNSIDSVFAAMVSDLIDKYYSSPDTRQFVDIYRKRYSPTENTVFSINHRANPVRSSGRDNSTVRWAGEDFKPYRFAAVEGIQHDAVDRQQVCRTFLLDYYGKPGRVGS